MSSLLSMCIKPYLVCLVLIEMKCTHPHSAPMRNADIQEPVWWVVGFICARSMMH